MRLGGGGISLIPARSRLDSFRLSGKILFIFWWQMHFSALIDASAPPLCSCLAIQFPELFWHKSIIHISQLVLLLLQLELFFSPPERILSGEHREIDRGGRRSSDKNWSERKKKIENEFVIFLVRFVAFSPSID